MECEKINMRFEKLRYKILLYYAKHFTPRFYQLMEKANKKGYIRFNNYDLYNKVPRPSILEISKRVKNELLLGVEIGVKTGINSESILNVLNMKILYLVDSWTNYDNIDCIYDDIDNYYQEVITKFAKCENVLIYKMLSSEFVKKIKDNSLDFVYIDGNHYYDYALQDLELYYEKVKPHGFLCGHDLSIDSVKYAVHDFCKEHGLKFEPIYPDFLITKP